MLVRQAMRKQSLDASSIVFFALALEIRAALAFARPRRVRRNRPLVPVEPQPAESLEDYVHRLLCVAGCVGVFYAQNESAAGVAGIEPVKQRGTSATDVQKTRRAGGKTDAWLHDTLTWLTLCPSTRFPSCFECRAGHCSRRGCSNTFPGLLWSGPIPCNQPGLLRPSPPDRHRSMRSDRLQPARHFQPRTQAAPT